MRLCFWVTLSKIIVLHLNGIYFFCVFQFSSFTLTRDALFSKNCLFMGSWLLMFDLTKPNKIIRVFSLQEYSRIFVKFN
jgi:hypothetical protein